jgi:hypothetical protein
MKTLALALLGLVALVGPASGQEEPPSRVTARFVSEPPGAEVVVDARERCTAPCKMSLLAGTHVVGMSHPGYEAKEEMVRFDKETTVRWSLTRQMGTLDIESTPEGLEVTVTGKEIRTRKEKTPALGLVLPPGEYEVVLADRRFARQVRKVQVNADEISRVDLEPVATLGTLAVQVLDEGGDPDKADVHLDGKRLRGPGPWELKPGRYRLEVRHRGKKILDQPIEVEAGSEIALDVQTSPE